MNEIQRALRKLGYFKEWLNYGLITKELLLEQYNEITNDASKDIDDLEEHYRYRAFHEYLQNRKSLTDDELKNIIDTLKIDEDYYLITFVITKDILTCKQLEKLVVEYPELLKSSSKLYNRAFIKRKIYDEELTSENFQLVQESKDTTLYRYVFDSFELTRDQLEWFRDHGNKAVRNMAKQKLLSQLKKHTIKINWKFPWEKVGPKNSQLFIDELRKEIPAGHLLYEEKIIATLGRRCDRDDFLFQLENNRLAVVHLTWRKETDPFWPGTTIYFSAKGFVSKELRCSATLSK